MSALDLMGRYNVGVIKPIITEAITHTTHHSFPSSLFSLLLLSINPNDFSLGF